MKQAHFQALRPVCPLCRVQYGREFPLQIGFTIRGHGDTILEGALQCSNPACLCEYPILDGIPLLVPQIRQYLTNNLFSLTARDDLSPELLSMLGEGAGPGSWIDTTRQHLSTYTWDHYGQFDGEERAGSVARAANRVMDLAGTWPDGPAIDVGCSVGRSTFELARRTSGLVLGIDINFGMLRKALGAMRGRVGYDRRKVGLIYERREFAVRFEGAERVDFWAADALALPFAAGTFSAALCLNVLDTVPSPLDLLRQLRHAVREGGRVMFATPYDWSPNVTPVEAWIGGHSPRAPGAGSSEAILQALLTPGGHAVSVEGLQATAQEEHFPWHVRVHERSSVDYDLHLLAAQVTPAQR